MSKKVAQPEHPINSLFVNRWSPRAFAVKPVAIDTIKKVMEAARWSASSYNEQPWRFIVGIKDENDSYAKIFEVLGSFNQSWAKNAPVLILGCGKKTFSHNQQPNKHYLYDVGQAMASLSLQATEEHLYLHQMAGFFPDKAREVFGIPSDFDAVVAVAMGYLGDPDTLSEKHRNAELAPRTRKHLDEICYGNGWDEAL